ncbi:hypothetical protein M9434_004567 [Picochlorum sp. BPE23]|nr:hypothetical protein M9434_004567 [Picochlorum sp. BPE23]
MSQLAEITTNGTVGESEKMERTAAQSVSEQVDTVSSHEQDTPEETPVEHGETTVPEKFDISDSVQEKEKEDAAKDVDQLLEYLASNQLNLSGPASANLMSLLENSGYKTPETQTAEPSHSPRAHVVSPERKKAEDTNTGMLGQWPGMAVPQQAPVFTGQKVGTAFEGIEPRQTAVLDCPKAMVGRVIGKGGETIKALQQYTGAMIQIDQSTDPTRVTIAGSRQSLQLAISMVSDIIKGRFKGFAMLRQIAISSDGMGLGHPVHA